MVVEFGSIRRRDEEPTLVLETLIFVKLETQYLALAARCSNVLHDEENLWEKKKKQQSLRTIFQQGVSDVSSMYVSFRLKETLDCGS